MSTNAFNAIAGDHIGMAELLNKNELAAKVVYDNVMLMHKFTEMSGREPEELDVESFMRVEAGMAQIVTLVRVIDIAELPEDAREVEFIEG